MNHPQDDTEKLYKAILAGNEEEGLDAINGEINYLRRFDKKNLLYLAVENNLTQIVGALIEKISENNISINTFNHREETLLTKALKMENYEIAKLLIQHKEYDINKRDTYKYTPLRIAARNGKEDIVRLLSERGAPNLKDQKGFAPQDLVQQQSQKTKDLDAQAQYQKIVELLGSKVDNTEITSLKISDMILSEDLVASIKDKDITEDNVIEK